MAPEVAEELERTKGGSASSRGPGGGRLRGFVRRHRALAVGAAAAGIALVVFVLVWFQPQKLVLDQRVDEALPAAADTEPGATDTEPGATAAPEGTGSGETAKAPAGPSTLVAGDFNSLEHATTGRAVVLELADGSRVLRFEDLETSNGPDLHVYLSEIPAGDDWYAYGERFVDLGPLKGNVGSQNYEIPDGVDLSKYRSAVIWCVRFSVGFGVAPLNPTS